jgi:hypothetical protein
VITMDDEPDVNDSLWPKVYGWLFCIAVSAMFIAAALGAVARY